METEYWILETVLTPKSDRGDNLVIHPGQIQLVGRNYKGCGYETHSEETW